VDSTPVESDVAPLPEAEPEQSDNRPRPEDGEQPAELAEPVEGIVVGDADDDYDPDRDGI